MEKILYSYYSSPLGRLALTSDGRAITGLSIPGDMDGLEAGRMTAARDDRAFTKIFRELDQYFSGKRTAFTIPVDPCGTEFEKKVWRAIASVPWGRTVSYSWLADKARCPGGARAAANACGKNPVPIIIPCHRVLRKGGALGGYTGGLHIKKKLLAIEGVAF